MNESNEQFNPKENSSHSRESHLVERFHFYYRWRKKESVKKIFLLDRSRDTGAMDTLGNHKMEKHTWSGVVGNSLFADFSVALLGKKRLTHEKKNAKKV